MMARGLQPASVVVAIAIAVITVGELHCAVLKGKIYSPLPVVCVATGPPLVLSLVYYQKMDHLQSADVHLLQPPPPPIQC